MKSALSAATLTILLGWYAVKAADESKVCRLRIRLVDAENGDEIPGLIRLQTTDGM